MNSLLVVTADPEQQRRLTSFFSLDGYTVVTASSLDEAGVFMDKHGIDVSVIDIDAKTNRTNLKRIIKTNPQTLAIVSYSEEDTAFAVSLINDGGYETIAKPYKLGVLYNKVEQAVRFRRLQLEAQSLRGERDLIYWSGDLIGHSSMFQRILKQVHKVARSNSSIILNGESGTGKEVIAGVIHYNSMRNNHAFVRVNCAALHEDLLESELFGHEKGAFTGAVSTRIGRFESANEGTIFLDEIADMSLKTQAKVLRVLQEQEFERVGSNRTVKVDVRVISATNKNLEEEIAAGRFREDLYYRLNVVTLTMPPLRERQEDIMPLANYFLRKFSMSMAKDVAGFKNNAVISLTDHKWPGNIRELKNCIERGVLFAEGENIGLEDIGLAPSDNAAFASNISMGNGLTLPDEGIELETVERTLVIQALEKTGWVQKKAAELLRVSPRVLNYKIKRFSITHEKWIVNS